MLYQLPYCNSLHCEKELTMKDSDISRRSFLGLVAGTGIKLFLPLQENEPETRQINSIRIIDDDGSRLYFYPNSSQAITKLNYDWDNFGDQQSPTPGAGEGANTVYSESVTAYEQLRLQVLNYETLTFLDDQQDRIMKIWSECGERRLAETWSVNSTEFTNAFYEVLLSLGYDGVVAPKADVDLGKVFLLQVWDPRAESWVGDFRAIALDVVHEGTFRDKSGQNFFFDDFVHNDEKLRLPWWADVSREIIYRAGLPPATEANITIFSRWREEGLGEDYTFNFPDYYRERVNLNPGYEHLGQDLTEVLSMDFNSHVLDKVAEGIPETFEIGEGANFRNVEINMSTFVTYLFKTYNFPVYPEPDLEVFNQQIRSDADVKVGYPFGNLTQRSLLRAFRVNNLLDAKIYSFNRSDDLSMVIAGLFFTEESPDLYTSLSPILSGVVITGNGVKRFVYMDGNRVLQVKSLEELLTTIQGDDGLIERTKRLIVYHGQVVVH